MSSQDAISQSCPQQQGHLVYICSIVLGSSAHYEISYL